jgi:hypothetical protein
MTRIREDVRRHFESEAERHPAPEGLRAAVVAAARGHAVGSRTMGRVAGLVAVVLGLTIVAGVLAVGAVLRAQPTPVKAPKLLFHDNLAAAASGRPSLPDEIQYPARYPSLSLAVSLPATPDQGTVYALDPALAPTPQQLGMALGVTSSPTFSDNQITIGDIQYFPASGAIAYERQSVRTSGPGSFPHAITSAQSAIAMARTFLVSHGLFRQDDVSAMRASAERSTAGIFPIWTIHLKRTLAGVADYGSWGPGATLQVIDNGRIDSIIIDHLSISGSERVGLIDAAEAWRQITNGHWYVSDDVLTNSQRDQPPFIADQAELCYYEENPVTPQNNPQRWLVPMWCFADTTTAPGFTVRLYYPALLPGSFDWKLPSH